MGSDPLRALGREWRHRHGPRSRCCIPSADRRTLCMDLSIETELEEDGRWIAEVPQLPGVLAYGATAEEAAAKAEVLALRVLAERLEQGESKPLAR